MKGKFRPNHPEKYKGDPTNILYRSSWELKVMSNLDKADNVETWSSEELSIPYISPLDGKRHRYFVDFVVKYKDGKTVLIEVKPDKQTRPPEVQTKKSKKYIKEVMTWAINSAKWVYAQKYCEKNGYEWKILTEKELFVK